MLTDLIQENVRNRFIYALSILMLYIALVFIIIAQIIEPEQPPDQIKIVMDMQNKYNLAKPIEDFSPSPRIKLINEDKKKIKDTQTELLIIDFMAEQTEGLPECDIQKRSQMAGTLEYLRLAELCRPVLKNQLRLSSGHNITTYNNVLLERGPEGLYGFQFAAHDPTERVITSTSARSKQFYVQFESQVSQIEIVPPSQSTDWFPDFIPGQPLTVQPSVRLYDNAGNPIKGKFVVALVWPEPQFRKQGVDYNVFASKYAQLSGEISEPSDSNGLAVFTRLTVVGSTMTSFYLFMICDNSISKLWSEQKVSARDFLDVPYFKIPLLLSSSYPQIKIEVPVGYSLQVIEGQQFQNPIKVLVKDKATNNPMSNVLVFALLSGQQIGNIDINYVMGYRYKVNTRAEKLKELIKPIPGIYNSKFDDPLLQERLLEPILTDSQGLVTFQELCFSQYGPAGIYYIAFYALGEWEYTDYITVNTTVAQVKIVNGNDFANKEINIDTQNLDHLLSPIIQVLDINDVGIPGKIPLVTVLDVDGFYIPETQLQFFFNQTLKNQQLEATDQDGFLTTTFFFQYMLATEIQIKLQFEVDGVKEVSPIFKLINNQKSSKACGAIIQSLNNNLLIKSNSSFDLSLFILNQNGDPLQNANVYLYIQSLPSSITLPPRALIPQLNCTNCKFNTNLKMIYQVSNAYGEAKFYGLQMLNTPNTWISINVIATSIDNDKAIIPRVDTISQQKVFNKRRIAQDTYYDGENEFNTYYDGEYEFYEDFQDQYYENFDYMEYSTEDLNQMIDQSAPSQLTEQSMTQETQKLQQLGDQQTQEEYYDPSQQFSSINAKGMTFGYLPEPILMLVDSELIYINASNNCIIDAITKLLQCSITMQFFDYNDYAIANQKFFVEFIINNVPAYLSSLFMEFSADKTLDQSRFYKKFFLVTSPADYESSQQQITTDNNGQCVLQIQFVNYFYGIMLLTISSQGIYSNMLIFFREVDQSATLQIQQQPNSNRNISVTLGQAATTNNSDTFEYKSQYCDIEQATIVGNVIDPLNPFIIKVTSATNPLIPMPNIPIIATVVDDSDTTNEYDKVLLDIPDIVQQIKKESTAPTVVLGQWRVSITDNDGLAKFDYLSLIDSRGCHCVRFQFKIDQAISYQSSIQMSPITDIFCFKQQITAEFINQGYSTIILPNKLFKSPIKVQLKGLTSSAVGVNSIFQVFNFTYAAAMLYESEGQGAENPIGQIRQYTDNFLCYQVKIYDDMNNIPVSTYNTVIVPKGCILKFDSQQNQGQFSFSNFIWRQTTISNFRLTFSTLMNYNKVIKGGKLFGPVLKIMSYWPNINKITDELNNQLQQMDKVISNSLTGVLNQAQQTLADLESLKANGIQNFEQINALTKTVQNLYSLIQRSVQADLSAIQSSVETTSISVQAKTNYLQIISQPPQTITVKELIPMTVLCLNSGAQPVSNAPIIVSATLSKNKIQQIEGDDLKSLINLLGNNQLDIKQLKSLIKKSSNLVIDKTRDFFKTKYSGKAFINTRIMEGAPGYYTFTFQSGATVSKPSVTFQLLNRIQQVIFAAKDNYFGGSQKTAKIQFEISQLSKQPVIFDQIVLQLSYDQPQLKVYSKDIKIKVFKYIDPEVINKELAQLQDNLTSNNQVYGWRQAYEKAQESGKLQDMASILKQVKDIIFSAGNIYQFIQQQDLGLQYTIQKQNEILETNKLFIFNMSIFFQKYGDYQIQICVDGIETPLSSIITVKAPEAEGGSDSRIGLGSSLMTKQNKLIIDFIFIGLILLIFFYVNTIQSNELVLESEFKFMNSQINTQIFELNNNNQVNLMKLIYNRRERLQPSRMLLVLILIGLFIIMLDIIFVIIFVDYSGNELNFIFRITNLAIFFFIILILLINLNKHLTFCEYKDILIFEYTFQKLHNRPSKQKEAIYQLTISSNQVQPISPNLSQNIYQTIKQKKQDQISQSVMQQYNLEKSEYILQKQQSLLFQIIEMLTSLDYFFKNKLCLDGFYFFPQKFYASIFISTFSIAYIFVKVIILAIGIQESIIEAFLNTKMSFSEFIATANRAVAAANISSSLTEKQFASVFNIINIAEKLLESYLTGVQYAMMYSGIICLICFFYSSIRMLLDFRQRVFQLRRGFYDQDIKECKDKEVDSVYQYLGFHISNEILAFIILFIPCSLALSILCWKQFWILLWENIVAIIVITASFILTKISIIIVTRCQFCTKKIFEKSMAQLFHQNNQTFLNRSLFLSCYELYQLYLNILGGIISAITRAIKFIGISLLCLFVIDQKLYASWVYSSWIAKNLISDMVNKNYLCIVYLYHISNNPIAQVFTNLIYVGKKQYNQQTINTQSNLNYTSNSPLKNPITNRLNSTLFGNLNTKIRLRNRMWLYFFLYKNQHLNLHQMRKAYFLSQNNQNIKINNNNNQVQLIDRQSQSFAQMQPQFNYKKKQKSTIIKKQDSQGPILISNFQIKSQNTFNEIDQITSPNKKAKK